MNSNIILLKRALRLIGNWVLWIGVPFWMLLAWVETDNATWRDAWIEANKVRKMEP